MKNQVEERQEPSATAEQQCQHYWIIEVANGPTSMGECKYCGERRKFHNAFPTFNALRRGRVTVPPLNKADEDEDEDLA